MTTEYEVTSQTLGIQIRFYYEDGQLMGFKVMEPVSEATLANIFAYSFFEEKNLLLHFAAKPLLLTKIETDISFDTFWEAYNHKVDRKRAEDVWHKLKDADKAQAIHYIGKYDFELRKTGVAKMYGKTYLGNKVWR